MNRNERLGQIGLGQPGAEQALGMEAGRQALTRRGFLAGSAALLGGGALLALPGVAKAHDTADPPSDIDILNYALTLEHLEYAFYRDGLRVFNARDFERSKLFRGSGNFITRSVYDYFRLIRDHEDTHVDTLEGLLGTDAVPELDYNFKTEAFTSLKQFISVAQLLENTGVTAYDGAIAYIEQAELLTAGAQIATVEARHASYLNLLNRDVPFPDAFDMPVAPRDVFDAAAGFITTPLDQEYGPYDSLSEFRDLLPDEVIQ